MPPPEPNPHTPDAAEPAAETGVDVENAGEAGGVEPDEWGWTNRPWQRPFIEAFGTMGDVSSACQVVRISRATAYRYRQSNEGFALAWADAVEKSADALELELRKAATVGWPAVKTVTRTKTRTFVNKDGVEVTETDTDTTVTQETERSVTAAIFLLNGLRAVKYKAQVKVEHGGSGEPVRVKVERERSPKRLEELLEIARELDWKPEPEPSA